MEITSALTLSHAKLPNSSKGFSSYNIPSLFHYSESSLFLSSSSVLISFKSSKSILTKLKAVKFISTHKKNNVGKVLASSSEDPLTTGIVTDDRWLLEPVGDEDSRHMGFSVELPKPFEIASDEVTVGRLPDEADLVIPIATVSGLHARIQKKEGKLLVTDLDSTNGTFIDDMRLKPGVTASVPSGSSIIFGDTHLAMFRVSKLEQMKPDGNQLGSEAETDGSGDNTVKP